MIDFKKAIDIANKNAQSLIGKLENVELESAILSDNNKLYEISLSYERKGGDPLSINKDNSLPSGLAQLASVMSHRRQYKTFLVDRKNGDFKGFKNVNNRGFS